MAERLLGDRIDRWLLKRGFRGERPLSTLRLIEARRKVTDPVGFISSRTSAGSVAGGSPWTRYVPRDKGYRLFGAEAFPELPALVEAGETIYRRHEMELNKDVNKRYFYNLMSEEDVCAHPELLDFALSEPVSQIATGYLGHVPRLHSIGIYYSSVNDTVSGSQMYHVDGDSLSQLKCFINIWDVAVGGGEFTFLTKDRTTEVMRTAGLLKTISDDQVAASAPPSEQIRVFGPAGSGVFVDTSRCLHQGSRARKRPRLVLQFQYVSRPDALIQRQGVVAGGHIHVTRRLVSNLKLSNADALRFVG
jgi:hypothetical protein